MKARAYGAFLSVAALSGLVACGSDLQDPQLAMCQAMAKQLTDFAVTDWQRIEQSESSRNREVTINYATVGDRSGSIECNFPIESDGSVASAPRTVMLNGEPVESKRVLSAGVAATKDLIAGTAAETAERVRELAGEASVQAREVANQTGEAAREALDQASESARAAAASAVGKAVEAGQALQEKLEQ